MRRTYLLLGALLCAVCLAPSVAVHADTPAETAAKEIADARERANRAADAYFAAESRIDTLAIETEQLQAEIDELQRQVDELQQAVKQVAVNRFTRSGSSSIPVLSAFDSSEEQSQITALINVINDASAEDFDNFDALNNDLIRATKRLAETTEEAKREKDNLGALRDAATAEVQRLKDVEAERLKDEAVRLALAAEEAARARKAEAEQRAAAAQAAPQPTTAPAADATDGEADDIDSSSQTPDPGAPAVPVATNGGVGAGRTGGGGTGGGSADYGGVEWVCPTGTSPVSFGDTWGAPRSGGRRHEGVDMIGERGTPILAVVDGFAKAKSNTLGGTTVWFSGADGNKYYYAHLDSYGTLGDVAKGTVIGYMGDTGNAKFSVVHLHFEIHPGGGPARNPYPTVRLHC
jgi:murein DD-endopeptidase MepM/ murein hydrolase activator NlpD